MKNKTLLLFASLFFLIPLRAQTFKLDVDGDAKIIGNLDIANSADNPTSLYIGKFAGANDPGTAGLSNVGLGFNALRDNTSGESNTALGLSAMLQNEIGNDNTAVGYFALSNNTDGVDNTAVGANALGFGAEGFGNTAVGKNALLFNTADNNVAVGYQSLQDNTSGGINVGIGNNALQNNSNGNGNVAVGTAALATNISGTANTAIGNAANVGQSNLSNATAIGANAVVGQSNSLVLGNNVKVGIGTSFPSDLLTVDGTGLDNDGVNAVVKIISGNGAQRLLLDGNEIDAVADGIFMNNNTDENIIMVKGGGRVTVGTDTSPDYLLEVTGSAGKPGGGFWSDSSDRRLKKDVEDFEDGLAEVLKIRPVWYRFNGKFGLPTEERYVGVIAQEIQEVAPYTVSTYTETDDETGETGEYLNYNGTAVVYMLVNAVQEQQEDLEKKEKRIESQVEKIEKQEQRIRNQEARLAKIEALLGKLSIDDSKINNSSDYRPSTSTTLLTTARLEQNQPNPFSNETLIRYYLPKGSVNAEIRIANLEGRLIKSVPIQASGEGQLTLDARAWRAGTYLYSLLVNGELIATEKMILLGKK